jgi:hypothetical protein
LNICCVLEDDAAEETPAAEIHSDRENPDYTPIEKIQQELQKFAKS